MRMLFGWIVGILATLCGLAAIGLFLAAIFTLSLGNLVFSIVYALLAGGLSALSGWCLEKNIKR